jgi:hypothetical protein
MGLAKSNPGGQWRLGLSATAASAVLYSAIVLFGVGSASPSAPDSGRDPHASAVLMQAQAGTVSGSVQKLPQASAEPRRHRSRARARHPRTTVVAPTQTSSAPPAVAEPTPTSPRVTESEPPAIASSATDSVADPPLVVTVPVVPVPPVTVPLPELPVPLPELPQPQPQPLPLPLPLP